MLHPPAKTIMATTAMAAILFTTTAPSCQPFLTGGPMHPLPRLPPLQGLSDGDSPELEKMMARLKIPASAKSRRSFSFWRAAARWRRWRQRR